MSIPENFWPADLLSNKIAMPKTLLLEQAAYLSERTNNQLVGEIKTVQGTKMTTTTSTGIAMLSHEFIIKAPALGNYQFTLLNVNHEAINIYPLTIINLLEGS